MSEREIIDVEASTGSDLNQRTRESNLDQLANLAWNRNGDPVKQIKKSFNVARLGSESRPFTADKDFTSMFGSPSSIKTVKTSSISKDATINGVEFVGTDDNSKVTQVHVSGGATAVFIGCTFRRQSTGSGANMVEVDSDSFAIFLGCRFINGVYPILNNAVVGSVFVIGSVKSNVSGGQYHNASGNAVTLLGSF
tara:strand:+ start:2540 stop:3124 length:585 start_codon:yes stop_codon:yes gene_type:complete